MRQRKGGKWEILWGNKRQMNISMEENAYQFAKNGGAQSWQSAPTGPAAATVGSTAPEAPAADRSVRQL